MAALWFVLALAAFVWAAVLAALGGIDTTMFGFRITSNEPLRPLLVANVALLLYVRAIGAEVAWTRVRRIGAQLNDRLLAVMLAAAVVICGLVYATTAVGGADAYGYVSQADRWIDGELRVIQPWVADLPWPNAHWTASPLGYRPSNPDGGTTELVPVYSPGLPLLMAGAKAIFGHGAVFWIVPLSAGVLVLATFGIGSQLGSPRVGVTAAWLLATSPIVLFMLMPAMSDIPAAAAWAAAAYFALRAGATSAILAGIAGAAAIAIRPNLAMLALPVAAWVLWRQDTWRDRVRRLALFAAGIAPGVAGIAWHFARLYGSPFSSGYGDLDTAFQWAHVLPNLRRYLSWFVESQTWLALAGLAAVFLPIRAIWPFVGRRVAVLGLGAMVALLAAQYLPYFVYDTWWFLRFFLPGLAFVCIGLAAVLVSWSRARRPALALAAVWLIVSLGLYDLRAASQYGAFGLWRGERTFPDVSRFVRETVPDNSVVFSLIYSGALRYYGGRMTLRYDTFDPDWLDRGVAWLETRGVRAFALLEPWEVPEFEQRFRGQRAAELSSAARLVYRGINTIVLYELSASAPRPPRRVEATDPRTLRAVPPVEPPTLQFAR